MKGCFALPYEFNIRFIYDPPRFESSFFEHNPLIELPTIWNHDYDLPHRPVFRPDLLYMFYVVEKIFEPIFVVLANIFILSIFQSWQYIHIFFELVNFGISWIFGRGRLSWPTITGFGGHAFLVVIHAREDRDAWILPATRELLVPLLDLLNFAFRIQVRDRLRNWYETSYEKCAWTTTQLKNGSPCIPFQCLYRKRGRASDRKSALAGFGPWSWDYIWQTSKWGVRLF